MPSIFWSNILLVMLILSLTTLLGRAWSNFFPYKLKPVARFFLAPSLGFATWVLLASFLGRWVALGNSGLTPFLFFTLLGLALFKEKNVKQAVSHSLIVAGYGLICGVSVFVPLYFFGGFNAHNDAFTYLAHSDWLQNNYFNQLIAPENVTPASTQVSQYQKLGLRMGASYLLAFFQAIFNVKWAYDIYPAVNISVMAACFLSMGFPLIRWLLGLSRSFRLMLLSFPALSMGGMVFAANFGFLPQVVGLGLGASFLFALGPLLATLRAWFYTDSIKSAIPIALLFSSSAYAYSELTPFLSITIFLMGIGLIFFSVQKKNFIVFFCCFVILSALLLNTEIIKMFSALRTQAGAVVGSPVDWPLWGFIAHAQGLHGGAWDLFQWTGSGPVGRRFIVLGIALLVLGIFLLTFAIQKLKKNILSNPFTPSIIILIIFLMGILYFRYVTPSPFQSGVGQSWSQFKLAEWAHPFLSLLLLLGFLTIRPYLGNFFKPLMIFLFILLFFTSVRVSKMRMNPMSHYYSGITNISEYYQTVRNAVLKACYGKPIYFALTGYDHKFRQMMTLFLNDQKLHSNWMDDGYIYNGLLNKDRIQNFKLDECIIEPVGQSQMIKNNLLSVPGPVRLGYIEKGGIKLGNIKGSYGREVDGKNWWEWVEHKMIIPLEPYLLTKKNKKTTISLEYSHKKGHQLILTLKDKEGHSRSHLLPTSEDTLSSYEITLDMPSHLLNELSIISNGKPEPISTGDTRRVSFMIRNLRVIPNE